MTVTKLFHSLRRLSAASIVVCSGAVLAQAPVNPRLQTVGLQDLTQPGVQQAAMQETFAPQQPQIEPPVLAPQFQPPVTQQPVTPPPQVAPQPAPDAAPQLPTDPGAQLPPQLQNVNPQSFGSFSSSFGATAGSFSAAPTIMGDIFAGGFSAFGGNVTATYNLRAPGSILGGAGPGQPNSQLGFGVGNLTPDDIFTIGNGIDASGDSNADTFQIQEPIQPTDAPTAPGPGFVFNNGTAVYVDPNPGSTVAQDGIYMDGDTWYISYSYINNQGGGSHHGDGFLPVPGPGIGVRRVKLSENFSPEVRDRCFFNYNFFNDAYGGLGDVSRYTFGFERVIWDQLVSLEFRLPTAGTYGSTQVLGGRQARNYEVGNPALIAKGVLLRRPDYLWTAGCGITAPLADNTKLQTATGQDVLVVENNAVSILPFTGLLLRLTEKTFLQGYMQLDVAASGNPIYGNAVNGALPRIGVFNDSTLLHADFALNRTVFENRCSDCIRSIMLNAEVHYSGTLQESDLVDSNGLVFTNLQPNFNVVNATFGAHCVLANNLVISPAMAVPLRRKDFDKQFDYEAILQLNYLR